MRIKTNKAATEEAAIQEQPIQRRLFQKTAMATAVATALLGSGGMAIAQTGSSADDAMEEIVVTGIRQSLKRSMDLKRNRDGVVDAITAEDIGDFPDTNLAESLQRISGVSIDRVRGEGSKITVRGFGPDYNLVLLNGRQMPTSAVDGSRVGRSFDFANLASENIAAIEVYKTGQADVPSGGVGSCINIRTTKPLDSPGRVLAFTVTAVNDESRQTMSTTPQLSGIFHDTFMDDTVGIAISASMQERKSGLDQAQVAGWRSFSGNQECCNLGDWGGRTQWGGIPYNADQVNRTTEASETYAVPQTIGYIFNEYEQTRINGQLTLQWQARDDIQVTFDYTLADFELERNYNNYSAWFNFGNPKSSEWTDGPNAAATRYTEITNGSDFSMGGGTDSFKNKLQSTGLNLMWDATDQLAVEFDYHRSISNSDPNSPWGTSALLSMAAYTRDNTTGLFSPGAIPVLDLGLSNPLDPDDMQITGSVFEKWEAEMIIDQLTLSGKYEFDSGFIESIDFGIQMTDVDYHSAGGVLQRDSWSAQTPIGALSDLLTPENSSNRFDQIDTPNNHRRQLEYYSWDLAQIVQRMEQLVADRTALETDAMGNPTRYVRFAQPSQGEFGPCGTGLCPASNPFEDRRTQEESISFYAQINMATELGSMPIDIRLGVRQEETDVASQLVGITYTGLIWVSGNEAAPIRMPNDNSLYEGNTSYDVTLPNLDFKIDFTDDIVGRFSYGKTMTRPNYDQIQGGLTIGVPIRADDNENNGFRGNPNLLPFESTNTDLSIEWYYDTESYVSAGWFQKDVENFITTSVTTEPLFNLSHPINGPLGDAARATGIPGDQQGRIHQWILENRADEPNVDVEARTITGIPGVDPLVIFKISTPSNGEKAKVDGFEIAWQHAFGESGFGFVANATFADSNKNFNVLNLSPQFVLNGLGDSANFSLYYDKDGTAVRVAWNWRDTFLAGTGQANVGAAPPTYVDAYSQVDVSASHWFNDNIQVSLDVINLTNETRHLFGRNERQVLFAEQTGPRYMVNFRYKM